MFCGTNTKMVYGLSLLFEGFVEHGLILRGKINNEPIQKRLNTELNDLARFIKQSSDIQDQDIKDIILGIAVIARGFYKNLEEEDIISGRYPIKIKQICDLILGIDNQFYKEYEGKVEDMELIVDWINNSGVK